MPCVLCLLPVTCSHASGDMRRYHIIVLRDNAGLVLALCKRSSIVQAANLHP